MKKNISFFNLHFNDKVTDYFNQKTIDDYYNTEFSTNIWCKTNKYSFLNIPKSANIFKDDFDWLQIYYENKTNKITYISGAYQDVKNIIDLRDKKFLEFKSKFDTSKLIYDHSEKVKHIDKTGDSLDNEENFKAYEDPKNKNMIKFSCLFYEKEKNELRIDFMTLEFEEFLNGEIWDSERLENK